MPFGASFSISQTHHFSFSCLGASQHLKNKYGSGYLLEVKLQRTSDIDEERFTEKLDSLEQYIMSMFPLASRVERFGVRTQYKVPRDNVTSLASTFSALEAGNYFQCFAYNKKKEINGYLPLDSRKCLCCITSFRL